MALTKQIMGSSLLERSLFVPSSPSSSLFNQTRFLVPLESKRVVRVRKAAKFPVATISEDLLKGSSSSSSSSSSPSSSSTSLVSAEKPVKFKVRAVITVRNKIKEDLKETIVKHIDALADKIGRNVVLELVSTEIDPSKNYFLMLLRCLSQKLLHFFPKPLFLPTQYHKCSRFVSKVIFFPPLIKKFLFLVFFNPLYTNRLNSSCYLLENKS